MTLKPALFSLLAFIGGCSVYGGRDHFDCPGSVQEGAICMSARQVYGATHASDTVRPNYDPERKQKLESAQDPSQPGYSTDYDSKVASAAPGNTYRPPLPEVNAPVPIRTPPKILRAQIFPWQDNSGDLRAGGYVFMEITGRTWTIGEEQVSRVSGAVINPLASPRQPEPSGAQISPLSVRPPVQNQIGAQSKPK